MLHQRHRIELSNSLNDWFQYSLKQANIICLPMTKEITIKSALLDYHHRDPADRFIIATALMKSFFSILN